MPAMQRSRAPGLLARLAARRAESPLLRVRRAYDDPGLEGQRRAALEALASHRLPFEEYVLELALLDLRGRKFSPEGYAAALGSHIHKRVEIAVLSKAEFELGAHQGAEVDGSFGRLVFVAEDDEVRVEVPAGLSPWLHQFTVSHELGHLAAGHPPRVPIPSSITQPRETAVNRAEPSPNRLARKPPIVTGLQSEALDSLYEAEADLRAQYAIITGSLGPVTVQTSRLSQIG